MRRIGSSLKGRELASGGIETDGVDLVRVRERGVQNGVLRIHNDLLRSGVLPNGEWRAVYFGENRGRGIDRIDGIISTRRIGVIRSDQKISC